ncbi:MAG: hypothetical protein KJ607_03710, partial [Bacteroidetes bacterium]|nr:hypothetical protein [Bacteroidota bacterium]
MNKILFTFSLLCIAAAHSCSLFGNETDSLRNELGNSSIDTNRVLTLVKLARQFYNVNNDTVIFYYDQALETSRQLPAEKERFIS